MDVAAFINLEESELDESKIPSQWNGLYERILSTGLTGIAALKKLQSALRCKLAPPPRFGHLPDGSLVPEQGISPQELATIARDHTKTIATNQ